MTTVVPLVLWLAACATETDTGPPECQWGPAPATDWTLDDEMALCADQSPFANEANSCSDGRIEYHCGADSYSFQGCFDAEGNRIGWYGKVADSDGEYVPWGTGTWCDCDGDGWPPTREEYCELRGEAPPSGD